MNRTPIDWTTLSWNPIQGCTRKCGLAETGRIWCYAYNQWRRFHLRRDGTQHPGYAEDFFVPEFFPDRLAEPARLIRPAWIFVCSMGELFDPRVPDEWIDQVTLAMQAAPQHTYVILTKQIDRAYRKHKSWIFGVPLRCLIGPSITHEDPDDDWSQLDSALFYKSVLSVRLVLSAEPLLGPLPRVAANIAQFSWLILGAQTGPGAVTPDPAWIVELVEAADAAGVPCWTKNNLRRLCPETHWRRQKPEV